MKLIALLVLSTTLCLSGCEKQEAPKKAVVRPVKSIVIQDKKTKILRSFPGKVLPNQETTIAFQVKGQVKNIAVVKGEEVKKGQLLAELDPSTYQDSVDRANAKYRESLAQYHRGQQLVKDNYISKSDYDKLRSQMEISKATLNTEETNLEYTKVYAPFDGVVAKRFVEQFDQVQAKQKVMEVHDISNVDIEVNIPENIIIYLRDKEQRKSKLTEDAPRVYFESVPGVSYPLKIKEYTTEADPDTQTYRVRLTMPQPKELNVLPGMSVLVKTYAPDVTGSVKEFDVIPSGAVFANEQQQPTVWVIDPKTMTVSARAVQVSKVSGENIRVLSGLNPGDRIVTAGVHFLRAGQQVKLMPDSRPPADQPSQDPPEQSVQSNSKGS